MAAFQANIARFARLATGFIPQRLPSNNGAEFDSFCDRIFSTYGLPDRRDYRQAIAGLVMHTGATEWKKPPRHFAASVRVAMAKNIAYGKIEQIRREEAEEARAKTEAQNTAEAATEKACDRVEQPISKEVVQGAAV